MNVPCGGIHAGQRYTVQSRVIEIVLDRSDSMFISLRHRVDSLCSVRYNFNIDLLRIHKKHNYRHFLIRCYLPVFTQKLHYLHHAGACPGIRKGGGGPKI